jgi:hypothetical protein
VALSSVVASGCGPSDAGSQASDVVDVLNTAPERQILGNCWLYAQASWVESMHLRATGESFDVSQSYWTYWHAYDQIVNEGVDVIDTGGGQEQSNRLVLGRGLMHELDFLPEDDNAEMAFSQGLALNQIDKALEEGGALHSAAARADGAKVRDVLDEAFELSDEVIAELDAVFGADGARRFDQGNAWAGSSDVIPATAFSVSYTRQRFWWDWVYEQDTNLADAIASWQVVDYPNPTDEPSDDDLRQARRDVMIRVQEALHDRQPVVLTWDVDFNALEEREGHPMRGSFNIWTLNRADGPGTQGGHMTVVEDYQVWTPDYGVLKAGVTLDPNDPTDADKLDAALGPYAQVDFIRIKNSWGALRDDRAFAPGMPGYHDLWLNYLNGPIDWCPDGEAGTKEGDGDHEGACSGVSYPLREIYLPPGY